MRILVTGACGRLGSAVADVAGRQDIEVIGIDRADWSHESEMPAMARFERGDCTDVKLLDRLLPGCDAVIHTAGPHGADLRDLGLTEFLDGNVTANARLLEAATRADVGRVMFSSTIEVLVGRDWKPSGAAVLDESFPPVTDTQYALSRYLLEKLAEQYAHQHGICTASFRFMAFGYSTWQSIGAELLARSLSRRDAARAMLLGAQRDDLAGDVFHVGPETPLTNYDVIDALTDPHAVLERQFPGASEILAKHGSPLRSDHFWPVTSIRKARLILGYQPRDTFARWLREKGWPGRDG